MPMHIVFCREYAVAKECITEKAKANCEICEQLSRDTYNPFCPNNTDPLLYTNGTSNPLLRVLISLRSSLFRFLLAGESESQGEVARKHGARAKRGTGARGALARMPLA